VVKDFRLDVNPRRLVDGRERPSRADVLRGLRTELEDALDLKSAGVEGQVQEQVDRDGPVGFRFEYTPRAAGDPPFTRGEVEVTSEVAADTLVIRGYVREHQR
jgi:hypothetical protein